MSITIPTETDIDGSTFYQINIKLPLRSYSIKKRYSDFDNLVSTLCHQIGINHKDFPYALPPKKLTWLVKRSVIEERKKGLARFLNSLISDSSLRNEPEVLSFLQLPKNFKFQQKPEIRDENWHEMYRKVKNELNQESKVLDAEVNVNTVRLRERVRNDYEPQIDDLQKSAEAGQDNDEKVKKLQLVVQLQNTLYQLQSRPRPSPWQDSKGGNRRVFGGGGGGDGGKPKQVKETEDTLPLTNQELLQHQLQIHKNQDQELEQLRTLIARQRQIGETINAEVEEQNYLLDKFNEEVDGTTTKLKQARRRARKIL